MKRILFTLLVALLFVGCSSDNDETNTVNSHTVTLSDVKGTWVVVSAMPQSVVGIRLVLNDKTNCIWSDKFDNTFSGPYYFLENIDDAVLKEQCALIASDVNDKIHINDIKVLGQNVGNAHLYIMCDLMPLLPSVKWQYLSGVTALVAKHLIISPKMGVFFCAKPLKMGEIWCILVCSGAKISKFSANF